MIKTDILLIMVLAFIVKSTLIISSPIINPFQANQIPYKYANFGLINYHANNSYKIMIFNSSLCNLIDTNKFQDPVFVIISPQNIFKCSFTHQALIAQALGAKGIIFAEEMFVQNDTQIIVSDDGNGRRVHIACLFINLLVWDKLSKLSHVQIKTYFEFPHQKVSKIAVYLSASNRASYIFMRRLKKQYEQFGSSITIQPIYFTFNCSWCPQNQCMLNNGYCSFDYDNHQADVGQYIIIEQVIQYSIYKQFGIDKYLNYMDLFDECFDYNWLNARFCRDKTLEKINITTGFLNFLIQPQQAALYWRKREKLLSFDAFPEVSINGMIFRGSFNTQQIIEGICQSLLHPTKNCQQFEKSNKEKKKSYNMLQKTLISFIIMLIFVILAFRLYKRTIKRQLPNELNTKVNEIVANYTFVMNNRTKKSAQHRHQQLNQEL